MLETIKDWINSLPYLYYLQNQYIVSALILVGAVILAKIILFVFKKYVKKIAAKTKSKVDDMVIERTEKPLSYLIIAYGFKWAIFNLGINGVIIKIVNSVMALVFLLVIVRVIDIFVEAWGMTFAKKTKTRLDDVLLPVIHKAVRVVFVIIAFMWILRIWEVDITPYLAGAGIAGLVLGMALQDSLKNVFGGISLILDKTYKVGDKIKLDNDTVGTIHDIGLRSTKLITFDNEVVYIPNGYLANTKVQNYSRPTPIVRVKVDFGVAYGSNVGKVKRVILEVLKKNKGILDEPAPDVQFIEMGESALLFRALFWVERWDLAWDRKVEMTESIYNALNKAEINIPFPTRTIYLKKEGNN